MILGLFALRCGGGIERLDGIENVEGQGDGAGEHPGTAAHVFAHRGQREILQRVAAVSEHGLTGLGQPAFDDQRAELGGDRATLENRFQRVSVLDRINHRLVAAVDAERLHADPGAAHQIAFVFADPARGIFQCVGAMNIQFLRSLAQLVQAVHRAAGSNGYIGDEQRPGID
ncbi:hypothetical protein D3C81_1415270 [compost metagenome]